MPDYTKNLGIELIAKEEAFSRKAFNKALEDIDDKVTPITHIQSKAHFDMWKPGTVYKVDDIVRMTNIDSNAVAVCVKSGTSDIVEPFIKSVGDTADDNSVKWKGVSIVGGGSSGVSEHKDLIGRELPNQHPKAAITDLEQDLINIDNQFIQVADDITDLEDNLDKKVDKVAGKGLSTNDYTTSEKDKLGFFGENISGGLTYKGNDVGGGGGGTTSAGGLVEWTPNTAFVKGQLIRYENMLYSANSNYTSKASFDELNLTIVLKSFVGSWKANTFYRNDECVILNTQFFRCITTHTSSSTFDQSEMDKWELVGGQAVINTWRPNTNYLTDSVVVYLDVLYLSNQIHTSSPNFTDDMVPGQEKWRTLQTAPNPLQLVQYTKVDVSANTLLEFPISPTVNFAFLPIEVLKFVPSVGTSTVTTINFNAADANDFTIDNLPAADSPYVIFDGTMRLRNEYSIELSDPVPFGTGFIRESQIIDLSKFKTITAIKYN